MGRTVQSNNPDPDALAAVKAYWNSHVHDWKVAKSEAGSKQFFEEIEAYRFEKLHYLPRVVNFEGYRDKDILDVGCGVGNDLSRFAKAGARVTGIDLAEHSVELARRNFEFRNLVGRFLLMNGESMEFQDESFDLVYCHTVLHFTPNPDKMVEEIYRVLRPGGTAILMTVNRRSWLNVLQKVMSVEIDHLDSPIFYRYSIAEFKSMLRQFRNVEIVPERFPVKTKVHGGIKATLYNSAFVGLFNVLPRAMTARTGHHLMAFATK